MRGFDVFFDLRLKKLLSKQSIHRWLIRHRALQRHCNGSQELCTQPAPQLCFSLFVTSRIYPYSFGFIHFHWGKCSIVWQSGSGILLKYWAQWLTFIKHICNDEKDQYCFIQWLIILPVWHQTVAWNNADISSIGHTGANLSNSSIKYKLTGMQFISHCRLATHCKWFKIQISYSNVWKMQTDGNIYPNIHKRKSA